MKKLFLLVSAIPYTACEFKNLALRSRRTAVYRETKERKYAEIFPLFLVGKEYNGFIIEGSGASEPALSSVPVPFPVRHDFCSWPAATPIALLVENMIGVHSVDAFSRKVEWRLPEQLSGKLAMKNLHFGNMETSIEYGNGVCTVTADSSYTLTVNNKEHSIHAGEQRFSS